MCFLVIFKYSEFSNMRPLCMGLCILCTSCMRIYALNFLVLRHVQLRFYLSYLFLFISIISSYWEFGTVTFSYLLHVLNFGTATYSLHVRLIFCSIYIHN